MSYTGVSYPFRLSTIGGIALSSTTTSDPQHIKEGIQQFLGTRLKDRVMEPLVGSALEDYLFDPSDDTTYDMVRYEAMKCLEEYDDRITIVEEDTTVYGEDGKIVLELYYTINKYEDVFTTTITL